MNRATFQICMYYKCRVKTPELDGYELEFVFTEVGVSINVDMLCVDRSNILHRGCTK